MNQRQIIEQAKFTYSALGKAFEKQTKTIEDQGKKQLDALESLKPSDKKIKDFISIENQNPEIITEIKKIEEEVKKVDRNKMVYKTTKKSMILETLKQCVLLVTKLEIMLLMMIWQMMNKTKKYIKTY